MAQARQVVKYTFLKVEAPVLSWPAQERVAAVREFTELLEAGPTGETLLAYSTVGLRGDCDLLIWQAADTVDAIQRAESQWRATRLGPYLRVAHSFLAMMKPSPYLGRHKHPDQEGRRTRLKPAGGRYLFVYPMVKKRIWYRLPYERRKAMMVEHFAIGHRYPQVKINTAYSFGLDDQEFVVAFECDEPAAFLDLVMELRESQASRYTERETPIFTCVLMPPAAALQLVRRLGVDGAVLFADIMLPVAFGLGVDLQLVDGVGPVLDHPLRSQADIDRLQARPAGEAVPFVLETIKLLRRQLDPSVAVIGFSGAPFTLAGYLIEGKPSREFLATKTMMYSQPSLWEALMQRLSRLVLEYLLAQVEAGAQIVQVFDSWVGCLSPADYRRYVLPHMAGIFSGLRRGGAPSIHFGTGTAGILSLMR